jgi:S1-C subfamily serine protease
MRYRHVRIPFWLVTAFFATIVIGSSPGPATPPDCCQPAFRITTPAISDVITRDVKNGVLITDVLYSPLLPGDVIIAINGHRIACQRDLDAKLAELGFGQPFTLDILRDGRIVTVTAQQAMTTPQALAALDESETVDIRGIRVADLPTQNGVIVADVLIGTPASDAGLKSGDIILDVDGHPVHTADEFFVFMRQLSNRRATFNVRQRNGQINVFVIPS